MEVYETLGYHLLFGFSNGLQYAPNLKSLLNGNFVVVWQGESVGDDQGISGQLFNSNAEKIDNQFLCG